MQSASQEDEFTEVNRKRKKRKATSSPTLPTLQKTDSSEHPLETPVRPSPSITKNKIPVIISGDNLLSQNLMCNVTGIIYKVEDFRQPVSVTQCFNCQSFGHSAKNCRSKQKCLICGESHSHHGCSNKEARKPKCAKGAVIKYWGDRGGG